MSQKKIHIDLTNDEALVLFEFLSRYSKNEQLKIEHQAEQRVLWNLEAILEKALVEPFKKDCAQLVLEARERVKDKE